MESGKFDLKLAALTSLALMMLCWVCLIIILCSFSTFLNMWPRTLYARLGEIVLINCSSSFYYCIVIMIVLKYSRISVLSGYGRLTFSMAVLAVSMISWFCCDLRPTWAMSTANSPKM